MTLATLHDGPYRDAEPGATLAAATKDLYQAFADHAPRSRGGSCRHCVGEAEARQLGGHVVVLPPGAGEPLPGQGRDHVGRRA